MNRRHLAGLAATGLLAAAMLAGCSGGSTVYQDNKEGLEAVSSAVEAMAADISATPNAKAWLKVDDTNIDNMVMQASDNDYYLRRDEQGNYSVWGCYYADYEADLSAAGLSRNTVVYGHSSLDDKTEGQRFTELKKFNLFDFADEHRCFYFSTADNAYIAEVFSVGYWPNTAQYLYADMTDTEFKELIEEAQAHSIYNYPVEVTVEDKIITLSTCTGNEEERFVVMAVVHDGAENNKDIGKGALEVNSTPKGA